MHMNGESNRAVCKSTNKPLWLWLQAWGMGPLYGPAQTLPTQEDLDGLREFLPKFCECVCLGRGENAQVVHSGGRNLLAVCRPPGTHRYCSPNRQEGGKQSRKQVLRLLILAPSRRWVDGGGGAEVHHHGGCVQVLQAALRDRRKGAELRTTKPVQRWLSGGTG